MRPALLLLAAAALLAQAQTAPAGASPADRYHAGARAFVDGEQARALREVEAGLAAAPDDARLQALRDLIEQQQQEQDDQDGGQQDQADNSDASDDGQDGDQGEQGQNPPDRPEDDGPEAERDQTQTGPSRDGEEAEAQPAEAAEMSRAQADRILDAVGGEERLLLRELRRAPTQRRRSDKDW